MKEFTLTLAKLDTTYHYLLQLLRLDYGRKFFSDLSRTASLLTQFAEKVETYRQFCWAKYAVVEIRGKTIIPVLENGKVKWKDEYAQAQAAIELEILCLEEVTISLDLIDGSVLDESEEWPDRELLIELQWLFCNVSFVEMAIEPTSVPDHVQALLDSVRNGEGLAD